MGNGASTLDNAGPLQLPVSPRSAKGNRKTSKTKKMGKKGARDDDFVNPMFIGDRGAAPSPRGNGARAFDALALSTRSPATPGRCQLVRKDGAYALHDRRGALLLTAKATSPFGILAGGWSVFADGKLLGKAVAADLEATRYTFAPARSADAAAAMRFAPNPVNRALPPALTVVVPLAGPMKAADALGHLRFGGGGDDGSLARLTSVPVHWDGEGWVLHFPKDVDVRPSAKNFQLADRAGRVCLTLARTMADTYCVEFAAPLSEFTALCACLASIKSYRAFQS